MAIKGMRLIWLVMAFYPLFALATPLRVGISQNAAPERSGNTVTFERQLLAELLLELGYEAEFVAAPHIRLNKMLQQHQLDIAVRQGDEHDPQLFYTSAYLQFDNRVYALASFQDQLVSVQDLARYSLASFQHAPRILGDEFAAVIAKAPSYREIVDHKQLVDLLSQQRVQLLVLDKVTFERRWRELGRSLNDVRSFSLFPVAQHNFACHQQALCLQLDQLLSEWRRSGRLETMRQDMRKQRSRN